ncbi:murein L,D-transpeptidase [Bdellovibrio sp. KM01]|uniref:L,D-transpeptidase family protein n=1 Tax=Bdellovibrio sp. KM01 TaxID=2748865 RepID=UPI001C670551|nr:L,D-transpeptidase family protein [Bdellovibrio sp. KM01]
MKMKDFISSNEVLLIIIGIFLLFPLFSNAQALVPDAQSSQMTRLIQDAVSNPASANFQILLNTDKLKQFYTDGSDSFHPYWIDQSTMQPNSKALVLRKILEAAPSHGLWDVYWNHAWDPVFDGRGGASVQDMADMEVKLSEAYLKYAHHIYIGRFDPRKFDSNIEMAPVQMKDFMLRLKKVAREPKWNLAEETDKLNPSIPEYRHLKLALANLRNLADKSWNKITPAGAELALGVQNPKVVEVKRRLAQLGYRIQNIQSPEFDADLDKNLKSFQLNSGLKVDGKIGANFSKVLNHLNVPLEQRIKQIELNMERYRWIPRKMDTRYIFVNVAMTKFNLRDDSLWSEKENKWAPEAVKLQFRTINGRDVRKTPLMIRKISRVEFNPTWTVPSSIAIKDKLPILQKDPTYLDKHKMFLAEAVKVEGKTKWIPVQNPDWTKITEADMQSSRYIIVQKQGYDNALGVVKFPLDGNSFSIYLHDTNERDLFNDENRHASSGCVRLQRPLDLAAYLLKDKPGYSMDEILKIVPSTTEPESRPTKVVSLAKPITVYLHYLTVFAKSNGEVGFADDDYGQDPILLEALNSPANNSSF